MKKKIINKCKELNIDLVGFCDCNNFGNLENKFNLQSGKKYKTPFQVCNYYNMKDLCSTYTSAIVFGVSYQVPKIIDKDKAYFSSFSWGEDYHIFLKNKLKSIKQLLVGYDNKIFVDNNILDERYFAYLSGIGFYGRNGMIINEKIGSCFFIGIILTTCNFDYDVPVINKCLNCNLCIDSCSTKSIMSNGLINGNTCLSYLTQKKNINDFEKKYFNNCIYGCDICNMVCPYNKNIKNKSKNFLFNEKFILDLENFNGFTEKEYNDKYINTSCFWRGKSVLERNIMIAKENMEKKL